MTSHAADSSAHDDRVNEAIAAYLQAVEAGQIVERDAWLAGHPEIAAELALFLDDCDRFAAAVKPVAPPIDSRHAETLGENQTGAAGPIGRFSDYELLEELARGGMGVVFRARQVSLNRIVAVKMILAGQLASNDDKRRFLAEAEAAASLQHPNIVAIHEVRVQDEQHYFSMDFIDGTSLAAIARDAPITAERAAAYVRTIADAIAYAHDRGILHRDLKPSNVLIDRDDRPRITDFGLAKKLEGGPELTSTGQILGTPAYMPPEQAAGRHEEIGPASDVYALGAILYELLCGRAPFRGETPLETLKRVLEEEPIAPRLLNSKLPRDLETICLKCLQKDPRRRYPSAQELAQDLASFQAGEAIRARPPGAAERAGRWFRKQRRSVAVAIVTAGLAAVVLGSTLVGLLGYRQWQLGYLNLRSREPILLAEVLDGDDQLAAPRFTVPTQAPLPLPSGSYRARFTGGSLLSETYQVFVERSMLQELDVPARRPLWNPLVVPRSYEVIERAGRNRRGSDLLLMSRSGLSRLDGATAATLWTAPESSNTESTLGKDDGIHWDWTRDSERIGGRGTLDRRPHLVQPSRDLDRDGAPDLVWAGRHQAFLLALSGKTGKALWSFCAAGEAEGAVVGEPAWHDVDHDGVADLVATLIQSPKASSGTAEPRRWIEAISGKTGKSLWSHDLNMAGFLPRSSGTIPQSARWPVSADSFNVSMTMGNSGEGIYLLHSDVSSVGSSAHAPFAAQVIDTAGEPVVACVAGSGVVGLNPNTGERAWPEYDLGFAPEASPRFADLDGDRYPEMLALRNSPGVARGARTGMDLMALSLVARRQIWTATLDASWSTFRWYEEPPDWPLVSDLDSDGRPEIIVAHRDSIDAANLGRPWGGIRVLDGASGKPLWQRRIRSKHKQVDRMLVGPDIDGDGKRELFTATLVAWSESVANFSLFVDAFSGRDGRTLWWRELPLGDTYSVCEGIGLGRLAWWTEGADGWPQLVVPYLPSLTHGVPRTSFLSAGDGRVMATAVGVGDPRFDDLDGDGFADLHVFRPSEAEALDRGGTLVAVASPPPEEWRRLGGVWSPAPDVNGDGIADAARASDALTMLSGRDGTVLWHVPDAGSEFIAPRGSNGDLDRDGISDLLVPRYSVTGLSVTSSGVWLLQARSGRTGRYLWTADLRATVYGSTQLLEARDLDGDGQPEVLLVDVHDSTSLSSDTRQWWATLFSGQDGRVLWAHPLSDRMRWTTNFPADGFRLEPTFADLNGDRVLDVVLPAILPAGDAELRAVSGRDGTALWHRPLESSMSISALIHKLIPVPTLGDLDGDGTAEVVFVRVDPDAPGHAELLVLDGKNGKLRWNASWTAPSAHSANERAPTPVLAELDGNGRLSVCLPMSVDPSAESRNLGPVLSDDARTDASARESNPRDLTPRVQVVVWNGDGRVRWELRSPEDPSWGVGHLIGGDVDGDNAQDLVWHHGPRVRAVRGHNGRILWDRSPGPGRGAQVALLSIEAPQRSVGATVITREDHALYGLAGATGLVRWWSEPSKADPFPLATSGASGIPRILDSTPDRTVCRLAVAGENSPAPQVRRPVARERSRSSIRDPRLARPLPWKWVRNLMPELALSAVICLMGLALPAVIVRSALTRRSWSLRRALAVVVVIGLCFTFFRRLGPTVFVGPFDVGSLVGPSMFSDLQAADAVRQPLGLLLLALEGAPSVAFCFAAIAAMRAPRNASSRRFINIFVIMLHACSGAYLALDSWTAGTDWYYTLDGWPWGLLLPAYLTGAVLLVFGLLRGLWEALRRVVRYLRNDPSPRDRP